MYQPKVNNIQQYSDNQGKHIVHKGKLVFTHAPFNSDSNIKTVPFDLGDGVFSPIIISETEEIEKGDKVLYANSIYDVIRVDKHNRPIVIFEGEESQLATWNKILVFPEHFSEKHLQAIVDGKMKDGDEVLIKCFANSNNIWLDFKNHITLFPSKQSLEEAAKDFANRIYSKEYDTESWYQAIDNYKAGAEWAKENNY